MRFINLINTNVNGHLNFNYPLQLCAALKEFQFIDRVCLLTFTCLSECRGLGKICEYLLIHRNHYNSQSNRGVWAGKKRFFLLTGRLLISKTYFSYMDILNDPQEGMKERHGCVTAWLIFMVVANSIVVIMYLFARGMIQNNLTAAIPSWVFIVLGLMGIANIIFAVALLKWKKWGFWGFAFTSIIAAAVNLQMGTSVLQTLLGLGGVAILYAILRIRKDEVSAWDNLE
jgi:hypothetical protein